MYSIFFNHSDNLKEIASLLEKLFIFSFNFEENDGFPIYKFYYLDIEFIIFDDHLLEDDQGIEFTKYKFQLNINKLQRGDEIGNYNDLVFIISKYVTEKIKKRLDNKVILVEDLYKIISI